MMYFVCKMVFVHFGHSVTQLVERDALINNPTKVHTWKRFHQLDLQRRKDFSTLGKGWKVKNITSLWDCS